MGNKKRLNVLLGLAAAALLYDGPGVSKEPAKAMRDDSKPATLTPKVWAHRKRRKAMYRDSRKHSKGKK